MCGRFSKLEAIELKQKESARLRAMLQYYDWLVQFGLSWDVIRGLREHPYSTLEARSIKRKYDLEKFPRRLIDFKLVDGSTVVLPWPPFEDAVIFNRPYVEGTDD